ncbi:acyltransferase family protein [Pseudomonas saudiphocaensis]|uniref:acyltransferase family protein n=1 Tax=Pseudomonas saudiphocaensis TaxID=1499686 RepID=UPI000F78A07B|nr:acyltransferase family protein [Pseudomonas saudiphocaensis]RRV17550.1 acyltransferase [Pseudomonas saudiphocaensis]
MSANINFRSDIQGLRAIAVLVVILFHFNPAWLPGGFVGVDVFLVLSGYLIVSILLYKKHQPGYRLTSTLRGFYVSRLKRIAPAYFAMLVLVSLLAAVLLLPQDLAVYKEGLKQAAWFNSNHYFADFGDYFAPANHEQPLLHTWSLAVEIQFYLLAPLLVLLLPVKALKWLFAALLITLTAVAEYRLRVLDLHQATYYSLYARLPEFFAGGLLALCIYTAGGGGRPWFASLGLVLLLASVALQPQLGHFPGLPALLPVAGALLILLQPAQGFAGQLLASKPMVWLGELSYSLYLWHWPVLALLRYYTGEQVLDMPFSLLFITLTLVLASLSYYMLEAPLRARHARYKQILGYGLLAGAVLAISPSMARINKALTPTPLPVEYQRYADPATICHGQIVGDCLKGDLSSDKEVLVLGDSHAAMLNLFFDQLGKDLGFKARIITASSCVTIPGFDYLRIAEWAHKPCLAQIDQAQKYLTSAQVIFLAASWHWQLASDDFQHALSAFLAAQSQAGSKIYLLEQEPLLSKNPLRALRFKALGLEPNMGIDPAYQQANASLQRLTASHSGVISLNFEASGVFAQAPFADGTPIYLDEHHLNEEGAKRYAVAARSAFIKIMD